MIDVNITIPSQDIVALQATVDRYVQWFRKGPKEAIKKTCVYIVRSLRASTKIGAKTRRIVKNPDYAKTGSKRERQLMHIAEWNAAHGRPSRMPQQFQKYAIQRYGQRGGPWYRGVNGDTAAQARTAAAALDTIKGDRSNIYRIAKRGLAKASWGWMLGKLGKPSLTEQAEIGGTVTMQPGGSPSGAFEYSYIDLSNKLNYIRKTLKGNVGSVMARANRAMIDEMEGHIKQARRDSGLRAA
jgi:peptidoglycan hydrolase-like protein with peptidoglycan-binding domain